MQEQQFTNIYGGAISLQCRSYEAASCREFSVCSPKLSLRGLTACTCAVWLAAYALFAYTENTAVLSAAIFVTLIGLLFYLHFVKIDQESLLVIASLGIQMTSYYASGKESTTFIEMNNVKDVVINEAIYMQKVIYYLCILLKDPVDSHGISEVVPVFQTSASRYLSLIGHLQKPLDLATEGSEQQEINKCIPETSGMGQGNEALHWMAARSLQM